MDVSRYVMQFYREEHMRAVRRLAGNRYSPNAERKKTYINLISLYTNIVSRSLFSANPRAMLSTFDPAQKPVVSAAESWMNMELVRQNAADKLKRLVLDGLMSMGIAKVCLATPEDAALLGWGVKAGQPLLSRVNLCDFVFDHRARDFDEVAFMGHRYAVPLAVAKENPHFNKAARDKLQARSQIAYNKEGDERIGEIGRTRYGDDEDLEDMVELWEVYLPRHKVVRTLTESDMSGPTSAWEGQEPIPLREQRWIGPETGPFIILPYQIVPGQIFPKGPIQDLMELDEGANESYRKLMRQAARLKVNTVCGAQNSEDGQNLKNASDGDSVPVSDPQSVRDVVQGGPHAGLFQWTKEVMDRFMLMGGNLMTMGGLAPEAGTLGQEQLLMQQSNGQVAAMQDATVSFVTKICSSMLWYFWNDPKMVMEVPVTDPRLPDVHQIRSVHPWTEQNETLLRRTGPVPDLKIDPYSMRTTTPQQRAKDLTQLVTQIYVPLAQLAQQQGITFDFNAFLGIMAKYLDAPDLQSILTIQDAGGQVGNSIPSTEGEGGSPSASPQPREYIRRSLGGYGRAKREMESGNALSAAVSASGNGKINGQVIQ